MKQISSTQAKQCFGELLRIAATEPVAIERHARVKAIIAAPSFFPQNSAQTAQLDARRLARANQLLVEKDRLIKHQRIAIDLVTLSAKDRNDLIRQAKAVVQRWKNERLCSAEYIRRWSRILAMPPRSMAVAMVSDADGWGTAMRQNSPWIGVRA